MKNKSYRNGIIISIVATIIITSGIGISYAADFPGSNRFGNVTSIDASGKNAAGFGEQTAARADNSIAFGKQTRAYGAASAAFGGETFASGNRAAAFGDYTTAVPFASFVIGRLNEVSGDLTNWVDTDPLFVIGNGEYDDVRNNAFTVLKNGNVGIDNSSPSVALVVEGSAIFGNTKGIVANVVNDGGSSFAFGSKTTASGPGSVTFGSGTTASGAFSSAFGVDTTASGIWSTAFGLSTKAIQSSTAAFGVETLASGAYSAVFGEDTTAQPYASFVIGRLNEVSGDSDNWVDTDPLFVIGNGGDITTPHNAVTVLKNGNVGIGTSNPTTLFHLKGDTKNMPLAILEDSQGHGLYIHGWAKGANFDPLMELDNIYIGRDTELGSLIVQSGSLVVGTDVPSYDNTLEVVGDVYLSGNTVIDDGYLKVSTSSGRPPSGECNHSDEIGRIQVDSKKSYLYVCTSYGWSVY